MIALYDYHLSADCYKVRLLLGFLGLTYETRAIEMYPRHEHRSEEFLAINPRGELPVLADGDAIVEDAQEILLHLARAHDAGGTWYPRAEARLVGQISMWLSFADALADTAGAARLHDGLLYDHIEVEPCRAGARDLLRVLDEHLWFAEQAGGAWICDRDRPTVADVACFPDVMLAEEGGISLLEFRAIRRWTDRVKRLPGFIVMPGIFDLGAA